MISAYEHAAACYTAAQALGPGRPILAESVRLAGMEIMQMDSELSELRELVRECSVSPIANKACKEYLHHHDARRVR